MATLRLEVRTCSRKCYLTKGRPTVHTAMLGPLEAEGRTAREACDKLAIRVAAVLDAMAPVLVMFDLTEPDHVWVTHQLAGGGWAYSHYRRAFPGEVNGASRDSGGVCGFDTLHEAAEAMRQHWYQLNVEPIVNGIVALCTSWREFVCRHCGSVQHTEAPYICRNPACGKPFVR